jgi:hypothetical protein
LPVGLKFSSSLCRAYRPRGPHSPLRKITGGAAPLAWMKRPGREANYSHPTSVQGKKKWLYTAPPQKF